MDDKDFDRSSPVYGMVVSVSHGNLVHPVADAPPCGTIEFVSIRGSTVSHEEIENRIVALQQILRTWGLEIAKVACHGELVYDAFSGKGVVDSSNVEGENTSDSSEATSEEILAAMKEKSSATH